MYRVYSDRIAALESDISGLISMKLHKEIDVKSLIRN